MDDLLLGNPEVVAYVVYPGLCLVTLRPLDATA